MLCEYFLIIIIETSPKIIILLYLLGRILNFFLEDKQILPKDENRHLL